MKLTFVTSSFNVLRVHQRPKGRDTRTESTNFLGSLQTIYSTCLERSSERHAIVPHAPLLAVETVTHFRLHNLPDAHPTREQARKQSDTRHSSLCAQVC